MPTIPEPPRKWLPTKSVFNSPVERAMLILAGLAGADDPAGAAMGLAGPLGIAVTPKKAFFELLQDMLPARAVLPQARHIINNDPAAKAEILAVLKEAPEVAEGMRNYIRAQLGSEFPAYRGGTTAAQPVSVSLNPQVAKWFARAKKSQVEEFMVTPESVMFPGSALDQELVIDPQVVRRRVLEKLVE